MPIVNRIVMSARNVVAGDRLDTRDDRSVAPSQRGVHVVRSVTTKDGMTCIDREGIALLLRCQPLKQVTVLRPLHKLAPCPACGHPACGAAESDCPLTQRCSPPFHLEQTCRCYQTVEEYLNDRIRQLNDQLDDALLTNASLRLRARDAEDALQRVRDALAR